MSAITVLPPNMALDLARSRITVDNAIQLWLAQYRSPHTRKAYSKEISRFVAFLRQDSVDAFLALDTEQAHTLIDAYKASLIQANLSSASVNRSMSALRSFTKSARRHGVTRLTLEPNTVPIVKYRDTKGPGTNGVQRLLQVARAQFSPFKAARDVAMIRLNFALGLRREEIVGCDLEHIDLGAATVAVKGKGEAERRILSMPPQVVDAVKDWLEQRGEAPGALFLSVDRKERMSASGYYEMIRRLSDKAGIRGRPHGIRHAAVTAVLDATGGDVRKAQAFARHKSAATTMIYDDNRQDLGGQAAKILDALVE